MSTSVPQQPGWSPGQRILNDTGAREPEHTFGQPVAIVARIVLAEDGEEYVDTEAAEGQTCRDGARALARS